MPTAPQRPSARIRLILAPVLFIALASCGGNNGYIVGIPNRVAVADFNGDGKPDVAVATAQIDQLGVNTEPGYLGIILQDTSTAGSFNNQVTYQTTGSPPTGLVVGDLTGTGTQDAVVPSGANGTLSVMLQTGHETGVFQSAQHISVGGEPNDVQMADINGDGLPDLIVADGTGYVEILLQNASSPGTFATPIKLTVPASNTLTGGAPTRPVRLAVADLNGDGLPDIVVTSSSTPTSEIVGGYYGVVTIFFQSSNSPVTYSTSVTQFQLLGSPVQVKIADLNGDGLPDLAIACEDLLGDGPTGANGQSGAGLAVLLNTPGKPGTFGAVNVYNGGEVLSGALSLDIGDLSSTGNQYKDVAMSSLYPTGEGAVFVLMHDPSNPGAFLTPTTVYGLGQPSSIVIHDMNGDGYNDLVMSDATTAGLILQSASSPGTFGSEIQIGY